MIANDQKVGRDRRLQQNETRQRAGLSVERFEQLPLNFMLPVVVDGCRSGEDLEGRHVIAAEMRMILGIDDDSLHQHRVRVAKGPNRCAQFLGGDVTKNSHGQRKIERRLARHHPQHVLDGGKFSHQRIFTSEDRILQLEPEDIRVWFARRFSFPRHRIELTIISRDPTEPVFSLKSGVSKDLTPATTGGPR